MKKLMLHFAAFCLFVQSSRATDFPVSVFVNSAAASTLQSTGLSPTGITVAGGNGPGSSAIQLMNPLGIFVDATGNLFVTDQQNSRIQRFASGSSAGVTVAGGNGTGSAPNQLNLPFDVFVDATGNIYIDEANGARVEKWTPGATSGTVVAGNNGRGSAPNQLNDPWSLYLDAAGNIYISDQINSRVQKWTPGGATGITVAGSGSSGSAANQLLITFGVYVDPAGIVYVCDAGNHRVQKWLPGASAGITVAGGNGAGSATNQVAPSDVFVDAIGNIYVSESDNNRVTKWTPGATVGITVAGGNGKGSASNQLNGPNGIFVDRGGNLYVSDTHNNRVQKFSAEEANYCLPNLVISAPSCNASAVIKWAEPRDSFPVSISIPEELDLLRGSLSYLGAFNGHGYYKSSFAYPWPVAKDISFYIGDTSVNGHLLTINNAAENTFIGNILKGTGYSPWIGLYNTGKPGNFSWVTGEVVGYTNWAPNEPNNSAGNPGYVKEPYVRFTDTYGNWNDQRSDNVPFIAEFEAPLVHYRQVSGPVNGSSQGVGVYRICYEITNTITNEKDTCCFSITVNCTLTASEASGSVTNLTDKNISASTNGALKVITSPNPSNNLFKLKISAPHQQEDILVSVTDFQGKTIETRKTVSTGQVIELGSQYRPGVYFVQVTQGSDKVMIKIIKQ